MIVSYRGRRTRNFAMGERVKAFSGIERSARLKLDRLEPRLRSRILAACLVIGSKRYPAIVGGSSASESTTSGGSALSGEMERRDHQTWKLLTIIRRTPWQ